MTPADRIKGLKAAAARGVVTTRPAAVASLEVSSPASGGEARVTLTVHLGQPCEDVIVPLSDELMDMLGTARTERDRINAIGEHRA